MTSLALKVLWNVSIVIGAVAPLALAFMLITRKPQVEAWWEGADAYSQFEEGPKKEAVKKRLADMIEDANQGDKIELPKSENEEDHFAGAQDGGA